MQYQEGKMARVWNIIIPTEENSIYNSFLNSTFGFVIIVEIVNQQNLRQQ